jgi:hypothetical protein
MVYKNNLTFHGNHYNLLEDHMNVPIPPPTLLSLNALATLSPAEALTMKDSVLGALNHHPFFKNIPLDPLAAAGNNLEESVRLTGLGDFSKIPERNAHLARLIKELLKVACNVQLQGIDEEGQLSTAGLPLIEHRSRVRKEQLGVVGALTGLEATNLDVLGEVMINAVNLKGAFGYNFQYTKLDPSVEENWVDDAPGPHRGCKKIIIRKLDSLSRYSFRGRGIGDAGPGPWSKTVTIPVT